MLSALLATLSVFIATPVEVSWVCAGNSYMSIEGDFDRSKCDGWLMVDGDAVVQFWQGEVEIE